MTDTIHTVRKMFQEYMKDKLYSLHEYLKEKPDRAHIKDGLADKYREGKNSPFTMLEAIVEDGSVYILVSGRAYSKVKWYNRIVKLFSVRMVFYYPNTNMKMWENRCKKFHVEDNV